MEGVRTGSLVMSADVAPWERGIGPTIGTTGGGTAAGSQTAPEGVCFSNCEVPADFYDDDCVPRTAVVQLDGAGTDVDNQTFKWGWLQEVQTANTWQASGPQCSWDAFYYLSYGIAVRFENLAGTNLANGWRWHIHCQPSRQRNFRSRGASSWFWSRG